MPTDWAEITEDQRSRYVFSTLSQLAEIPDCTVEIELLPIDAGFSRWTIQAEINFDNGPRVTASAVQPHIHLALYDLMEQMAITLQAYGHAFKLPREY
jgi:hypothetical protein